MVSLRQEAKSKRNPTEAGSPSAVAMQSFSDRVFGENQRFTEFAALCNSSPFCVKK
jgi:hypothetical protein